MVSKQEFNRIKKNNPKSRIGKRTREEQEIRNKLAEVLIEARKKGIVTPFQNKMKEIDKKEKSIEERESIIAKKEDQWEKEKKEREQEIANLEEKKGQLVEKVGELIKEKDLGNGSKVYFGENEFADMHVEFTDTGDVILKGGKEKDSEELLKYSKYLEKIALKRNRESNEYIISEIEEMVNKLLESGNIEQRDKEDIERRLVRLRNFVGDLNGLIECIANNFKFPGHDITFGTNFTRGSLPLMIRYFNLTDEERRDSEKLENKLALMSSDDVFKIVKEEIFNNLGKKITSAKRLSWINFKDVDNIFYIKCIMDGITDFIKKTTESSGVNRLIGNEKAVIEDLQNKYVTVEKNKEMFGKKGKIFHIELPAIGTFKGYKFDGFISKEKVKTSGIKTDSEYEEALYSAREINGLLNAIFEYKKQFNANKHDYVYRDDLEKIIGIKLPTPIILSDNIDDVKGEGLDISRNKESKSKRLTYNGAGFSNNSEGYLLFKIAG